jgi:glycosyltransferase involved in cell wall biosynthesis
MTNPLITIITPSFNQAQFVAETIHSILSQDYHPIEYRVVNDGSTDNTDDVIKGVLTDKFQYLSQDNRGQSRTLNEQWGNSEAKYLTYLSSDDLLDPTAVSKAIAVLEADDGVVCVFPDSQVIDGVGQVIKRSVGQPFDLEDLVVLQECYIGPGAVFRRAAFDRVGGWRPELRLAPDREFWMRLSREGRFHYIDEPLAYYRLHVNSYSVKETSHQQSLEYLSVLDDYFSGEVPQLIAARRNEAYANANIVVARNAFRRGDFSHGFRYLAAARELHPSSVNPSTIFKLIRNVVSKPIRVAVFKIKKFMGRK